MSVFLAVAAVRPSALLFRPPHDPARVVPSSRTPVVLLALPNRSACAGDDAALLEEFLSVFARRSGCESMQRRAFKLARAATVRALLAPRLGLGLLSRRHQKPERGMAV